MTVVYFTYFIYFLFNFFNFYFIYFDGTPSAITGTGLGYQRGMLFIL